jgi:hypothetical protein
MLADIVVDTNIFSHAQMPPDQQIFLDAKAFVEALLECETQLCVDGILDPNSPESSKIGWEYYTYVRPIGLGYTALVQLLATGRVRMGVSDDVGPVLRRFVVNLIPNDSRDRTFVFVAFNTQDRIVVSHDKVDYTPRVRAAVQRRMDVTIEGATDTCGRL